VKRVLQNAEQRKERKALSKLFNRTEQGSLKLWDRHKNQYCSIQNILTFQIKAAFAVAVCFPNEIQGGNVSSLNKHQTQTLLGK
jgi:hypothetical protein